MNFNKLQITCKRPQLIDAQASCFILVSMLVQPAVKELPILDNSN
jgi:hypothetical protein